MDIFKEHFAKRLKLAINNSGLSQTEIAERLEVKDSTVSRWVNGHDFPESESLRDLCKLLRIKEDFFLYFKPQPADNNKLVREMTADELEELVARASKRDGSINIEIARLKRELTELKESFPPELLEFWPRAEEGVKALCLTVLTGKKQFLLNTFRDERQRKRLLDALAVLGLIPAIPRSTRQ